MDRPYVMYQGHFNLTHILLHCLSGHVVIGRSLRGLRHVRLQRRFQHIAASGQRYERPQCIYIGVKCQ